VKKYYLGFPTFAESSRWLDAANKVTDRNLAESQRRFDATVDALDPDGSIAREINAELPELGGAN
jgi:hypothetical protein